MADSFGRLLKQYRVAAGLSQEALAERSGVSVDAISYLERDVRHAPHRQTLELLVAALTLDDRARQEIEATAKRARTRGPQAPESLSNNLPPELTSFVDREKELPEIRGLLRSHRLVTVVGTGGAGKTRSAIAAARGLVGDFGDGVWLADLSPISDPMLVPGVVAYVLNVPEDANRPILDSLLAYLSRKRLLLILDNCEHVIEEARSIGAKILSLCPNVCILATSRESFSITGELAYRIPSLPVPGKEPLSSGEISRYGAVQLFNDRAVSARHGFTLTADSAPHVADICRRLDGIPLAIELAAARINVLSPHELAARLDERFRLLTAGDRSALPRHRTMRALIDWSYDLLSEDERRLFRGLSIFAGGFSLEACTDVCGESSDEITVLELLSSLVDKSLVQVAAAGDGTRYRLLESTRQYAREKLRSAGEEDKTALAHGRAFLRLADELNEVWETMPDRVFFGRFEADLDNFRAALSWALDAHGDVILGQRLASALVRRLWHGFGPAEGQRWFKAARQHVSADTPAEVLALHDTAEAMLARYFGQYKTCLAAAERALTRYQALADQRGVTSAEHLIGSSQIFLGQISHGEALIRQSLSTAQTLGAPKLAISALHYLACARYLAGDLSGARQQFREELTSARSIGAEQYAAVAALCLAETEFRSGDAVEALRLVEEALPTLRLFRDVCGVALALECIAAYLIALGEFDEARSAAHDALSAARDAQFSKSIATSLQHLAAVAALSPSPGAPSIEEHRRAACILGYVNARLRALEASREFTDQREYDAILHVLRDAFGEVELARLMTLGSTWSDDQTVAEAMLI